MQVFKTFFNIAKSHMTKAIIYIIIFFSICLAMSKTAKKEKEANFTASSINICVFDKDNSKASKALIKYLSKYHTLTTDLKNVKDSYLQDSLYYAKFQYILTINKGYEDSILKKDGQDSLSHTTLSDTMSTVYATGQIDRYISSVRMYLAGGYDLNTALLKSSKLYDNKNYITSTDYSGNKKSTSNFFYYFQFYPYILLSILIMCMAPILVSFNSKGVKQRTACSSLKPLSKNFQLFGASIIYSLVIWLIFMLASMVVFSPKEFFSKTGLLACLNSFSFLIFSITITLIIGCFNLRDSKLSMVSNIVTLGMSFLCGIFVPQWYLGEKVLSVARFLPAYWYIKNNNMLAGFSSTPVSYSSFFTNLSIQLLFALAMLVMFIALNRQMKRE